MHCNFPFRRVGVCKFMCVLISRYVCSSVCFSSFNRCMCSSSASYDCRGPFHSFVAICRDIKEYCMGTIYEVTIQPRKRYFLIFCFDFISLCFIHTAGMEPLDSLKELMHNRLFRDVVQLPPLLVGKVMQSEVAPLRHQAVVRVNGWFAAWILQQVCKAGVSGYHVIHLQNNSGRFMRQCCQISSKYWTIFTYLCKSHLLMVTS